MKLVVNNETGDTLYFKVFDYDNIGPYDAIDGTTTYTSNQVTGYGQAVCNVSPIEGSDKLSIAISTANPKYEASMADWLAGSRQGWFHHSAANDDYTVTIWINAVGVSRTETVGPSTGTLIIHSTPSGAKCSTVPLD